MDDDTGLSLLDAEGGEIKAVAFGDSAERFADVFQHGRVYDVSKVRALVIHPATSSTTFLEIDVVV